MPVDNYIKEGDMSKKFLLSEKELPRKWYNILADMPTPLAPPLHPATLEPITPDLLAPIFPESLIMQEVTQERFIEIPEEILDILSIWRPTPLHRASRLEAALGTPAKIYFKNESVSPPGSHKPNTAVAQVYYNKMEGVKKLSTETGAGQWGSALSFATQLMGLECQVYMVKVSYHQKPYRRSMMHVYGASVNASPSDKTSFGRSVLEKDPDCRGSLGIAISEAIEVAASDPETKYSLGSVLNHVMLHQTIIGEEAIKQMEQAGDYPDIVLGCVGGGSNYGGLAYPFMREKLNGSKKTQFIAVEPKACPTLTKGQYRYDFGDTAMMTPLMKQYTLGHSFIPPGIHAGGLRYHGMASSISALCHEGLIEAKSLYQQDVFESAILFARTEGIIPAPETSHAVAAAVNEAKKCKETGEAKTILFNFSGHGYFDFTAYDDFFDGKLKDVDYDESLIEAALAELPQID